MADRQKPQREEIIWMDMMMVVLKRKKMILAITIGVAVIAIVISFLLPPIYRAEARILPPQQGNSNLAAQFLNQMMPVAGLLGMPVGAKTSGDLYVGILKSRTIFDRIIDKFGLVSVYHKGTKEEARKKLLETFNAHEDKKSGIIFLSVEDKDPKRAADMANTFVDELKNFCGSVAITEAAQRRLFFEEQLKGIRIGLTNAENEVKKFQEATGVLQLNDQAKAVLAGIASIRAQIAAKEVQMKVVRSYSTSQNPDLQKLEEESKGLLVELKKMEAREYKNSDPMMPTSKMTALGIEYIRKIRDLKYYESLFELIAKQYEAAKIDEARDVATIQLLDQAIPPEKIWKPARTQMIVISTICGLFFSLFIAFMAEYIEKLRHDPVREDQLGKFRSMLSGSNK